MMTPSEPPLPGQRADRTGARSRSVLQLFDLTDRVAIVTGGSRGIGRSIVQALAEAGAHVVIASRKLDACQRTADEVHAATGRATLAVKCHVGHWADCDRLVDAAHDHFGRIDVMVNNAGMSPVYDSIDAISETLYDKTLAVNLKGPFRLTARAATMMAAGDGGSIINISSIGALTGAPHALPYACAKAGLNAMTVGMADAFAPQVRVNAILPGSFWSDATKSWSDDLLDASPIPLGRIGDPNEITGLTIYLASDASSYTTGALIRVDGGVTRHV